MIQNKITRLVLGVLLGLILIFYLGTIQIVSKNQLVADFTKYWFSAKLFLAGESIYTPVSINLLGDIDDETKLDFLRGTLHPNLSPPFFTILMLPFGFLDYQTAIWIWSILMLLCGILTVQLLKNRMCILYNNKIDKLILGLIIFSYFPTWAATVLGQFSLLILMLVSIIWIYSRSGKNVLPGILLGLLLSMKLFTGLFLIFFAFQRRWRLIGWYVGTFLTCSLISWLLFGTQAYKSYFEILTSVTWQAASWNTSILGLFSRIFGSPEGAPLWDFPGLANIISNFVTFIILIFLIRISITLKENNTFTYLFDIGYSLTIIFMLMISPLGWMYYFPILIIPLVVVWYGSDILGKPKLKIIIVIAWLLSTIPTNLVATRDFDPLLSVLTSGGIYLYSLILFLIILFWLNTKLSSEVIQINHLRK